MTRIKPEYFGRTDDSGSGWMEGHRWRSSIHIIDHIRDITVPKEVNRSVIRCCSAVISARLRLRPNADFKDQFSPVFSSGL